MLLNENTLWKYYKGELYSSKRNLVTCHFIYFIQNDLRWIVLSCVIRFHLKTHPHCRCCRKKGGFSWLRGLLLGWFLWYKVTCSLWDAQGHSHSGLPLMAPALVHLAHPKRGFSVDPCMHFIALQPQSRDSPFLVQATKQSSLSSVNCISTFFNRVWILSRGMLLPNFFLPWHIFLHHKVFLGILFHLFLELILHK